MINKVWFKPKRFWKWFAAYYPVAWQGWILALTSLALITYIFSRVSAEARSLQETVYMGAPALLVLLLILDIITIRTGEYPSWWKKHS
jgi:hypothetical protein